MAIKELALVCDWCEKIDADQESVETAVDEGWWFVESSRGEMCFCCEECLEAWL